MAKRRSRRSKKGCHCPKGARRVKGGACLRRGKFVAKVCGVRRRTRRRR